MKTVHLLSLGLITLGSAMACTPPAWSPPPDTACKQKGPQVDDSFPAYDPNAEWPPAIANEALIPDTAFLKALLRHRIAVINDDGRPPGDETSKDVFPEKKWSGKDAHATFSETVAYYLKALVGAGQVGIIEKDEARKQFDRVFQWAKKNMQAGVVKTVYDADLKKKRSVDEFAGKFDDPKGTLVNRPGCFAWRYIPKHGVIRSKDYSKDSVQAATDADLEIAGSLVSASQVFGDKAYLDEARTVAKCLAKNLFATLETPDGKLTVVSAGTSMQNMNIGADGPGPQGFVGINPSYFINNDLAKLSKAFDGEMDGIFGKAEKGTYVLLDLLTRTLAKGSGLPPNWGQVNARKSDPAWVTPLDWQIDPKEKLKDVAYRYDAMRVPMRLRSTRLAGLDKEELKKYWLTTGKKGTECIARIYKDKGFFPAEVAPDCTVPKHWDKQGSTSLIAARAMFLETGRKDLADEALTRLMKEVKCVDAKETPPSGCTEAYFDPMLWEYFPGQIALMLSFEEAPYIGRSFK